MKKLVPFLFILVIVTFFFKPLFVTGLLPIPSDTIVGLYNPFRDLYHEQYPRGVPFKNFLITDPVRQQYPWRSMVISAEKNVGLPLWNPYNGAGTPLLANFQSGAFYPLNVLFFFLPFSFSWSFLIFLQPLLGGVFLYMYLKHLKLSSLAALLGSISFVFSGFAVSWLEWGTILQTAMWLPLLLLSIDKSSEKLKVQSEKNIWYAIFVLSLVCSFFSGHLQTFFYLFLITTIYILLKFFNNSINKKKFLLFTICYLLFAVVTAIQWLPTLQFISFSARNVDQLSWQTAGWFIPYQHLIQFISPDFFGNPTTLNYWGVWNYGELVGYIGIIPFIFSLYGIFFRHDKKTLFFSCVALVSLLLALPTPIAKIPYMLQIPFISTAQPTRLLFVIDFSLAILTALGLDVFFRKKSWKIVWILSALGGILGALWIIALKFYLLFGMTLENAHIAKQNLVFPTVIFLTASGFILMLSSLRGGQGPTWQSQRLLRFARNDEVFKNMIIFGILLLTAFDLLRFAQKFTPFTSSAYLFPSTKTTSFLQAHAGNYRIMTTDSRLLPPNFSAMYHIQSVDLYDPLYLRNYGEFIAASERKKPNINPPFGFNRIITPHNYNSPLINLLGVKYILSLSDIKQQGLEKVMQEGDTRIYENTSVLPRAFFVNNLVVVGSKQDAINLLFTQNFNPRKTAIIESEDKILRFAQNDEKDNNHIDVVSYQSNEIKLQTSTDANRFLVLTDMYYPTWHVYIDGKETKIYQADYAFRGIFVMRGQHTVLFVDKLF